MKIDTIEFKTTRRFRQYAIRMRSHWYKPWKYVCDADGTIILFSEKERDEKIKELTANSLI